MSNRNHTQQPNKVQNTPWLALDPARASVAFVTAFARRPVIAVDWNSTLQNQIGEICRLAKGLLTPADFDRWNPPLGHKVGMTEPQFAEWAWTSPLIQWRARPYPGAAEALAWLSRCAEVWIVTATCNPHLVEPWLKREGIPCNRIVIAQDKGEIEWDVLIDDSPITLARLNAAGRNVVRFAGPAWNSHLTHIPALAGWSKINQIVY